MDINKRTLRNGALVILAAVVLRIILSCTIGDSVALFAQPQLADYLIREKTEEVIGATEANQTEPTSKATEPTTGEQNLPLTGIDITEADSAYVELKYSCSLRPDIPALLNEPIQWNLYGDEPSVLIIHTHGTEAFTPSEGMEYEENGGDYRTTNDKVNMISLGDELTRLLQAAGINVIHDREYYDYPDYEASYDICREALQKHLQQNPTLKLVIDLHRDSATYEDGTQWATSCTVNGQQSAQVMIVMGTDRQYDHPNWEKNLSLGLKIHALMEKTHPGATRPLDLRKQRFNQDLSAGAIIAEVGSAGNTHEEAMSGVSVLAEAVIALAEGAK